MKRRTTKFLLNALLFILAAAGYWLQQNSSSGDQYTTGIGEQRTIPLADSTSAYLSEGTVMHARKVDDRMDVDLHQGQVLFDITHQSARVFRVLVPHGVIEDRGTQFEVTRLGEDTKVAVLEGVVWITGTAAPERTAKVQPGRSARILSDGSVYIEPETTLDGPGTTTVVRQAFTRSTLVNVAEAFNGTNNKMRFIVEESAREVPLSGSFALDRPEDLLDVTRRNRNLVIESRNKIIVIRAKAQP